jgi:uncharacterized protein (DUF2164 family)
MIRKWNIDDEQGDTDFGILAAKEIIDTVGQYVGPQAYNSAIEDAKRHCKQSWQIWKQMSIFYVQ